LIGGIAVGTLRLILALAVLLSHVDDTIFGHNVGVSAVVIFFMLSGYVMALLIRTHYAAPDRFLAFYVDRIARLFPQYLFYLTLTVALMLLWVYSSPYVQGCTGKLDIALNYLMLPLGYYEALSMGQCLIVTPAWSLGLELSFYIVVPVLLVCLSRRALSGLFFASLAVFAAAVFLILDPNQWGYRLLPGTLFMFLTGVALADPKRLAPFLPGMVWGVALALYVATFVYPQAFNVPLNKSVLAGLLLGIPLLAWVRHIQPSPLDTQAGNLSYGVFLNHFGLLALIEPLGLGLYALLAVVPLSLGLAALTYQLIELPVLTWRRKLRYVRPVEFPFSLPFDLAPSATQP
jgi:peptidoglycan/LPS O-acetylase OafA/YrhL